LRQDEVEAGGREMTAVKKPKEFRQQRGSMPQREYASLGEQITAEAWESFDKFCRTYDPKKETWRRWTWSKPMGGPVMNF
jgi:hypothetical protein